MSRCRARPKARPSRARKWTRCWCSPKKASASWSACKSRRWPVERLPPMKKIVLASDNQGKLAELKAMFAPLGLELVSQAELGLPEAEEPFRTFIENALAKARQASRLSG